MTTLRTSTLTPTAFRRTISHLWVDSCLRNYGVVLLGDRGHWCHDWDGLPIDENSPEMACCTCARAVIEAGSPLTLVRVSSQ